MVTTRDFQLLKENMIQGFEELEAILDIFNYAIQEIQVKTIDVEGPKIPLSIYSGQQSIL